MANSITLTSKKHNSRYFELECTQKSNGSTENSSTISWKLSAIGDSTYYSTGPTTVVINGTTVYSKGRTSWETGKFPVAQGSTSGTLVVPHNSDGTKKITVKFSTAIYTSTVTEYSESWTLDAIPRYGSATQSLNSKTETTVKMNWSSDSTVDYLWYSTNNGTNWTGVDVADGKSGTYTISSLSANTEYKIKTRVRRKDSQLTTDSSALSVKTYSYPYCTKAPDFVIGEPFTLTFSNPLNRSFAFRMAGNNVAIYAWGSITAETYTVDNEDVVAALYASIPNAKSAKYTVEVISDDENTITEGGTYSIDESKCAPTFKAFTYKDVSLDAPAITGNNQVLIKGVSRVAVEISAANKMVASHSATPDYYVAQIDTKSETGDYNATSAVTINVGTVPAEGTKRLTVRAYDSRGVPSQPVHKDVTVIDYNAPTISVTAKRRNNFDAETIVSFSGEYSPLTINGVAKNAINKVMCRYRETGGAWEPTFDVPITIDGGKFTGECAISLDNTKSFDVEVIVADKLRNNYDIATVDVGQAIFFISTNKKTCYINGVEVATVDLMKTFYPVGSVICTATNTNPSATYGGTWELIDKGFKSYSGNNVAAFTAGANVVNNATYISRGGNTIRIRQSFTINTSISDTGMTIGNFNWNTVGITQMPMGISDTLAYSDVANGGIHCTVAYDTGEVSQLDVFDLTPLPSGNKFNIDFTFVALNTQMLDGVCDKFYWKRTS